MMEKQILHIDVNNAFLSWTAIERLKQGETLDIREIPAVIGGDESQRSGIVLAKSMKAKQFGIITGETLYSARQKCRNLQIYPANHKLYRMYSDQLYQLFQEYTDRIERYSIDECFLDMTLYLKNRTLGDIAQELHQRIKEELGFTVNIGVAPNKLLAKMASDFTKPDKIHTLYQKEIKIKMWPLPVSELFMLGRKTVPKLNRMGIRTIGDLANQKQEEMIKKFGKHGKQIWEYANGIDRSEVEYRESLPKGIGNSVTLPADLKEREKIQEILLNLAEQVSYRLRQYQLLATTVNVQLRTKDFKDKTHQGKLAIETSNTKEIYEKAKELLEEFYQEGTWIRLVGLRVDHLVKKEERQICFWNNPEHEKQEKIDQVVDQIKQKYGYQSITRAGKLAVDSWAKLKEIN